MMMRRFVLIAATAAMAAAPVAANAAAQRMPAPVTAESEALRGNPVLVVVIIAVLLALGIVALTDGDDPVSP
jgi:hypothetical protein